MPEVKRYFLSKADLDWTLGGHGALEKLTHQYSSLTKQIQNAYQAFIEERYSDAARIFEKLYQDSKNALPFYYALVLSTIPTQISKAKDLMSQSNVQNSATSHYLQGLLQECENNTRKAVEQYSKTLEMESSFAPAMFRLGYHLSIVAEDIEAIEIYEKGLQNNPCYTNLLMNIGVLYEDVGKYPEAIHCYQRVLHRSPNHLLARMYLQDAQSSLEMFVDEDKEREQDKQNQTLNTPITDFELSVRGKNCLQKMKIHTLGDLVKRTESELLSYKNFGETSLGEIKDLLSKKGLKLGMGKEDDDANKRREKKTTKPIKIPDNQETMSMSIASLELSVRCRKCLNNLNVATLGDVCQKSQKELLSCKNFGQTSMNELKQKLSEYGLHLREEE